MIRSRAQQFTFLRLVAIVSALLILGGVVAHVPQADAGSPALGRQHGMYLVPGQAKHGVLRIVIPEGTGAAMRRGEIGYVLPSVIQLHVGDSIVIENHDSLPHMMLFTFVEPGETESRTFTEVVTETYSAGCTMDPTPSGFTSLFVSE